MTADDAAHGGHAEPTPGVLGREKRLEHARQRVLAHPDAVVDHVDEHKRAGRGAVAEGHLAERRLAEILLAGLDGNDAGVLDRFGGIDNQVEHHLPDLRRVGFDKRQ